MRLTLSLALCCGVLASQATFAADLKNGKALHDGSCFKCHDTSVYQRGKDGRVQSLPALDKQVRRCEQTLGLTWFDDQVEDVTHYLNATFYKFE